MTTEEWMAKLTAEGNSLKQSFSRTAQSIPVTTKTVSFSTTRNAITITNSSGSTTYSDPERVILTFDTVNGSSTLAKLEVSPDSSYPGLRVRRAPYSGGARWYVTMNSKSDTSWVTTNCVFTVQSFIDGTLSAGETTS